MIPHHYFEFVYLSPDSLARGLQLRERRAETNVRLCRRATLLCIPGLHSLLGAGSPFSPKTGVPSGQPRAAGILVAVCYVFAPGLSLLGRDASIQLRPVSRFTTISLLTENEPPPEQTLVASLGPSQVETCLVNSDRLPSPKMTQTVSLSPGTGTATGTTGSEFSSPELTQSLESPFVRGVSARSEERVDRSGKGKGGLVGWASKSFRRMSTPKQSSKKRLPFPESPNSVEIRPHALKR